MPTQQRSTVVLLKAESVSLQNSVGTTMMRETPPAQRRREPTTVYRPYNNEGTKNESFIKVMMNKEGKSEVGSPAQRRGANGKWRKKVQSPAQRRMEPRTKYEMTQRRRKQADQELAPHSNEGTKNEEFRSRIKAGGNANEWLAPQAPRRTEPRTKG